jgi:hypothetical protein
MYFRNDGDLLGSAADPRWVAIECPQAAVTVSVDASIYRWVVRNRGPEPLTRFELRQENCYNQSVPQGWKWSYEDGVFSAWADQPASVVQAGSSAEFTTRVSSAGAVLGIRQLTLGLGSGRSIIAGPSWAPVAKPASMMALVAVGIIAVAVFHMWICGRSRGSASCN